MQRKFLPQEVTFESISNGNELVSPAALGEGIPARKLQFKEPLVRGTGFGGTAGRPWPQLEGARKKREQIKSEVQEAVPVDIVGL